MPQSNCWKKKKSAAAETVVVKFQSIFCFNILDFLIESQRSSHDSKSNVPLFPLPLAFRFFFSVARFPASELFLNVVNCTAAKFLKMTDGASKNTVF